MCCAALQTVPTNTITETNWLIYAAATVIFEMLGYKTNSNGSRKEQEHHPWKRQLEAKIMATRREVSLVLEMQKGMNSPSHLPQGIHRGSGDQKNK